jgi:hypothetical protein
LYLTLSDVQTVVARVRPSSVDVGFVVEKVALGQVFSSTSVSPANHQSTKFSIIITTRGWYNRPIGGRHAMWIQLESTPPPIRIKKKVIGEPWFTGLTLKTVLICSNHRLTVALLIHPCKYVLL